MIQIKRFPVSMAIVAGGVFAWASLGVNNAWAAQVSDQTQIGAGTPAEALPPAQSDNDAQPPAPSPTVANPDGVTRQAGVGGTQAYGRIGVLELGGSGALQVSDGATSFNLSPSVGWFFVDNMQISAILGLSYVKLDLPAGAPAGTKDSNTFFKFVIEPSYHIPFSDVVYGFLGMGVGAAYNGKDFGFNLAPRLGANFLIGRSGILTPALVVDYSTTNVVNTSQGTLLAVKAAFGMQIGYTVMW